MNIAIASGKGGTGKTTVALSLATYAAQTGSTVTIFDCDVEEPNVNLFLGALVIKTTRSSVLIPLVDDVKCTGCGECERICAFSAIVLIKERPLVVPDMCHSCGGCYHVCPTGAISEIEKEIGIIEFGCMKGIDYAGGRLNIGEHMAPPLIKEVKKTDNNSDIRIIDCPPGTSCPVIESVRGCDYLVLVTEPTPFGLNDLRLAVDMAMALSVPFGVVINRAGIGNNDVADYCAAKGINMLAMIPNMRQIAEEYSRGDCVSYIIKNHRVELNGIMNTINENKRSVRI